MFWLPDPLACVASAVCVADAVCTAECIAGCFMNAVAGSFLEGKASRVAMLILLDFCSNSINFQPASLNLLPSMASCKSV